MIARIYKNNFSTIGFDFVYKHCVFKVCFETLVTQIIKLDNL